MLEIFTTYAGRTHQKTYEDLERDITKHLPQGAFARHFRTTRGKKGETYYWVSVIGFGEGVKIIENLPNEDYWKKSWLASEDISTLIEEFKS